MDALTNLSDLIGFRINAKSPVLQVAAPLLLLVGAISVSRPFLSLVRVLLSLFVLPGQSVSLFFLSICFWRQILSNTIKSSLNLVLVVLGLS